MKDILPFLSFGLVLLAQIVGLVVYIVRNNEKVKGLAVTIIDIKTTIKSLEDSIEDHRKENKQSVTRAHEKAERRVKKTVCLREMNEAASYNAKVCSLIEKTNNRIKRIELSLNTIITKYETESELKKGGG